MATKVEAIKCNFIGDFKVGDNMLANSNALMRLSATNEAGIFNKLMVVPAAPQRLCWQRNWAVFALKLAGHQEIL